MHERWDNLMRWLVLLPIGLAFIFLSYIAIGAYSMGFRSASEMDFNGDGSTSIVEIMTALDVVKVPSRDKPGCVEYLDAKSGTHVYAIRCPKIR